LHNCDARAAVVLVESQPETGACTLVRDDAAMSADAVEDEWYAGQCPHPIPSRPFSRDEHVRGGTNDVVDRSIARPARVHRCTGMVKGAPDKKRKQN